jgi:hypothetical protein
MLWLVMGNKSEQIISCNVHRKENGTAELWVERINGKSRKVRSGSAEEVLEVKEAIDYAIKTGHTSLELE